MGLVLQSFAAGDTNYISKLDANNDAIAAAIDAINTALAAGGGGGGGAGGALQSALLGTQTAFIGSGSYAQSTSSTNLIVTGGYAWRPDLGTVLNKVGSTTVAFAGQSAATYYITLGADGTPQRDTSSTGALWSVVWTGSAFGAITAVAPYVLGGDLTDTDLTSVTIKAAAVTLSKMANLAANSIIGNNTGSPATPLALTASQVKTLLAIADSDVTFSAEAANVVWAGPTSGGSHTPTWRALVVADLPFAGSANGVATLDSGGKVPTAQLPSAVVGALSYAGTWNANTNTPALVSSTGTQGTYYKVSVAGATTLDGISDWYVGDSVVFDGTTWDKISGADPEVVSVAGKHGAVTLAAADLTDGTTGSGAIVLASSPALSGNPTAPTQTAGNNSTRVATTAYVDSAIAGGAGPTGAAGGSLAGTYPNPSIAAGAIGTSELAANGVTLAKVATQADATILGNNSGGAHIPIALTAAQVKTLLAIASGDVSGLAASATTDTTNASNISSGTLNRSRLPTVRYDIAVCFPGAPSASQTITYVAARAITIDHTAPGSFKAGTASTGNVSFTINKNGASQGTVGFNATATGAASISSDITLAAGDILTFVAPVSPDATLADIGLTLAGLA